MTHDEHKRQQMKNQKTVPMTDLVGTVKKTLKRRHYPLRGLTNQPELKTPLSDLPFPVYCSYPDCGDGPFENAGEVDEHISDMHLPEAVWTFAAEHMKPKAAAADELREAIKSLKTE